MSELTKFRDHCREMATAEHSPECLAQAAQLRTRWQHFQMFREWPSRWGPPPTEPPIFCRGRVCISDADRELWARLAAEVDDYLDPHPTLWGDPA